MSNKIEELKAKQARELEAMEREETARDIITGELAVRGLNVVKFSPHVAYADYTVTVEPVPADGRRA